MASEKQNAANRPDPVGADQKAACGRTCPMAIQVDLEGLVSHGESGHVFM
jgi:hypothetical protein